MMVADCPYVGKTVLSVVSLERHSVEIDFFGRDFSSYRCPWVQAYFAARFAVWMLNFVSMLDLVVAIDSESLDYKQVSSH